MKKICLVVSVLVVVSLLNDAYAVRQYNQYRARTPVEPITLSVNNASSYKLKITSPCFPRNYLERSTTAKIPLFSGVYECDVTVTAVDVPDKKAKFRFNAKDKRHVSKDSSGLDSIKGEGLSYGIQDSK